MLKRVRLTLAASSNQQLENRYIAGSGVGASSIANRRAKARSAGTCKNNICGPNYYITIISGVRVYTMSQFLAGLGTNSALYTYDAATHTFTSSSLTNLNLLYTNLVSARSAMSPITLNNGVYLTDNVTEYIFKNESSEVIRWRQVTVASGPYTGQQIFITTSFSLDPAVYSYTGTSGTNGTPGGPYAFDMVGARPTTESP